MEKAKGNSQHVDCLRGTTSSANKSSVPENHFRRSRSSLDGGRLTEILEPISKPRDRPRHQLESNMNTAPQVPNSPGHGRRRTETESRDTIQATARQQSKEQPHCEQAATTTHHQEEVRDQIEHYQRAKHSRETHQCST